MEQYATAEAFINSPYSASDTWNAIESTNRVCDWILNNGYDSILITEGGIINYFFKKYRIVSWELN